MKNKLKNEVKMSIKPKILRLWRAPSNFSETGSTDIYILFIAKLGQNRFIWEIDWKTLARACRFYGQII